MFMLVNVPLEGLRQLAAFEKPGDISVSLSKRWLDIIFIH
jgi:hypothetical protein